MSHPKQIGLGLSMRYLGYHAAAWRHPSADPDAASKFSHYKYIAQTAEAAKLDMVFLADGIGLRTPDPCAKQLAPNPPRMCSPSPPECYLCSDCAHANLAFNIQHPTLPRCAVLCRFGLRRFFQARERSLRVAFGYAIQGCASFSMLASARSAFILSLIHISSPRD